MSSGEKRITVTGFNESETSPVTSQVVGDSDVKKLDELEVEAPVKANIDYVHQRFTGIEPLPSYKVFDIFGARTWLFVKIFLLLVLIGYTIAVLILDWNRGKPILFIEITIISFMLLNFCFHKFRPQLMTLAAKIKALPKPVTIAFQLLLLVAALAISIGLSTEDYTRLYGLAGLVAILLLCYALSYDRKNVNWRPVIWGFALQFVFALFILRTKAGENLFKFFGDQIQALLAYTSVGVDFVFGELPNIVTVNGATPFALNVLPVIIFFSGITSVLFYVGALQAFTLAIGNVMIYTMGTSAPESLSAAGNIFLGQTEAPLLIRPYLQYMTNSEIHAVMTGGFATIAGGVLAAFISFGIPAEHLLAASVMSAPAALAISKLVYPETVKIDDSAIDQLDLGEKPTNALEAFTRGATLSIALIANIIVNLIAFLALIEFLNEIVTYTLTKIDIDDVNFTTIVGYIFSPFALLMGIPAEDMEKAGNLLGIKIIANEFVAYLGLIGPDGFPADSKTFIIMTYALCGFSNFSSIGIQLGALGIMAPTKLKAMSKLALSAMFCGNIACFMTACIAGVLLEA